MPRPDIDAIRKASSGIYLGEPQCYVRPLLDYVAELEARLDEILRAEFPNHDLLPGCGGPYRMDAPGGTVCSCGQPSRHESGWCGRTAK